MTPRYSIPGPDDAEPARDARLGALLRSVAGETPMSDVDWPALAARVGAAVRAPQSPPWWSHVDRWQQRALPLALAAGLVGALAFYGAGRNAPVDSAPAAGSVDLVSAVMAGESSADAARSYAGAVVSSLDAGLEVPE